MNFVTRGLQIIGCTIVLLTAAIPAVAAQIVTPVPAPGTDTAQQTLEVLNAQRAANGIPAGITEDQTWSNDCLMHDEYMSMNGNVLTHTEVMGNPGYSAGGAFAGANSVLADGTSWADGNPYEHAPLHLDQLLAPRLDVLGSADADGFTCTTTFPGWTGPAPAALTVYTYPGPGATIYASEVAREQPFTPGTLVGLSPGVKTGPNLLLFVDAPGQSPTDNPATLSQATLSGPSGTVSVVTVDGNTAVPRNDAAGCQSEMLSCFIAPGGFIIPVKPLTPGATYEAHVVVTFAGVQTSHSWSFTTVAIAPDSELTLSGRVLHFRSDSPAPIHVTFTRATGAHGRPTTIAPGRRRRIDLDPGSWRACGVQRASGRFASFQQCLSILVTGTPKIHFGPPRVHGTTVKFRVSFSSVLAGRIATLTITPLTLDCARGACTTTAGAPTTRTLLLRHSITIPLPTKDHGVSLKLQTAAFQLRDAPWVAAEAVSRPFVSR